MNLDDCLPPDLRGATITKIAAGLSGAGVYRVETGAKQFVLKVTNAADFRPAIQIAAAAAGVSPRVVHVDEARHAVVSELVVDRSFPMFLNTPSTRDAAIALLGTTLRNVHAIPIPPGSATVDPPALLTQLWTSLAGFRTPSFVGEAVTRVLAEPVPASNRPLVMSHNDVNPTNLVYDGQRLFLLDWNTTGPNDPFFDLAAAATFFRMDDATVVKLLTAYDGTTEIPERFRYDRRLIGVMCGVGFLTLAHRGGHPGGDGEAIPLGDFYAKLRAGQVNIASSDGQWAFGLALIAA